jgi:hypothetical protein
MYKIIIILSLLCTSCSSLTIIRDKQGNVKQVKARGLQETTVGEVKHKMSMSWYPKDLINVVFGAKN